MVPLLSAPTRRGFGSTIIERSIPFDLGGKADIAYPVTGLHALFTVPARHVAGLAKSPKRAGHPVRPMPPPPSRCRAAMSCWWKTA